MFSSNFAMNLPNSALSSKGKSMRSLMRSFLDPGPYRPSNIMCYITHFQSLQLYKATQKEMSTYVRKTEVCATRHIGFQLLRLQIRTGW